MVLNIIMQLRLQLNAFIFDEKQAIIKIKKRKFILKVEPM